jgi:hypothetical protein
VHGYQVRVLDVLSPQVHGIRQVLSNPYTGALAIFTARYLE